MFARRSAFGVLLLLSILSFHLATAFAQTPLLTYQGRVTVNGSNFSGIGQFKFALIELPRQAKGTVNVSNPGGGIYQVGSVTLTEPGSGYASPPTVTFSSSPYGARATGTAIVTNGMVTGIKITNQGFYNSTPTVFISPPSTFLTLWNNDGLTSTNSEPINSVAANVSNGVFTVVLGDTTIPNMAALDNSVFTKTYLSLRIWFNDGVNGFSELTPPQPVTPAPFANALIGAQQLNIGAIVPAGQVTLGNYLGGTAVSVVSNATKQLVLGGDYNTSYNIGRAVKLLISDYDNDASDIYPIYVEDENNVVDFYLHETNGVRSAYFGGSVTAVGTVKANGVVLSSDRNQKENFAPVDANQILEKVASLPITQWNFKTDGAKEKHIGPMSQDFHAAFGLDGADDKHIAVVDEGGVALAAIQGLNQKVEIINRSAEDRIQKLETENANLRQELAELRKLIHASSEKQSGNTQ